MRQRCGIGLPVLAVELHNHHLVRRSIQAVQVHIHAVGVRPWLVERLDTADAAECVLGDACVEGVCGLKS